MRSVTATFRNGRLDLAEPVDWPDGTKVEVTPLPTAREELVCTVEPLTEWPEGFLEQLRADWGDEPFKRPPQGEFEVREDW